MTPESHQIWNSVPWIGTAFRLLPPPRPMRPTAVALAFKWPWHKAPRAVPGFGLGGGVLVLPPTLFSGILWGPVQGRVSAFWLKRRRGSSSHCWAAAWRPSPWGLVCSPCQARAPWGTHPEETRLLSSPQPHLPVPTPAWLRMECAACGTGRGETESRGRLSPRLF